MTEDLALDFCETVGDNLYYMWDKSWFGYCLRLSRHAGTAPGKAMLLTETGIRATTGDEAAARRVKQMLFCSVLHPEVAGIFIFEYCDEWYKYPGDPKSHDASAEADWGLVTADRKPKKTYEAAAEAYGVFEQMNDFLVGARPEPLAIVSGQDTDWWRGSESVSHADVVQQLYRYGVPFGLYGDAGLLRLDPATCSHLILCDTHLWAEPDGSGNVCRAILEYARRGGHVLYLCRDPFRKVGGYHDVPQELRQASGRMAFGEGDFTIVRELPAEGALWPVLRSFLREPLATQPVAEVTADGADLIWRVIRSGDEQRLFVVNVGDAPVRSVEVRLATRWDRGRAKLLASDGATLVAGPPHTLALNALNVYAVLAL